MWKPDINDDIYPPREFRNNQNWPQKREKTQIEPIIMDKVENVFKDLPSQEVSNPDSIKRKFSVTFNE